MEIKKLIDEHEEFAKKILKERGKVVPQLVVCKNNEVGVIMLAGTEREQIKAVMEKISATKPEWLVFLTEAYMKTVNKEKYNPEEKYRPGQLQEEFENNDPSVKEVVVIQVYTKDGKRMRILNKDGKKFGKDSEDFDGYLAINDVERVFWKHEAVS